MTGNILICGVVMDGQVPLYDEYRREEEGQLKHVVPVGLLEAENELVVVTEEPLKPSIVAQPFVWSDVYEQQRPSAQWWAMWLRVGDSVIIGGLLGLLLTFMPVLRMWLLIGSPLPGWHRMLLWGCIAFVSWIVGLAITRAQDSGYVANRLKTLVVVFALFVMLLGWMGISTLVDLLGVVTSLRYYLIFASVAFPVLVLWRIVLVEVMRLPRFRQRAVIVGDTPAGALLVHELRDVKRPTLNILGCIAACPGVEQRNQSFPVLGDSEMLRVLIQKRAIELVIMATERHADPELFQTAIEAAQVGITVVPMAMVYERMKGKIPVEFVGEQWYISLPSEHVISVKYLVWQKLLNVGFGLIGTLALACMFPVLALLISLDSPGPIFYQQERLGYQGKKIVMRKFRSMCTDAECVGRAIWAAKGDMRVTRLGRFLRATHLDELPQVLNILRGEMSLIGPRPEREEFVKSLEKTIPFYRCRLSVLPGLTGWAQVKYTYGSSSEDALAKLQYDLYYIKHRSFALDVSIILATVLEVLAGRGR